MSNKEAVFKGQASTLAFGEDLYNSHQKGFTEVRELGGCSEFGVFPNFYDGSNERLMPTGEELKDKNFMVGLWGYIQSKSKCNHMDEFRYVAKKDISPTKIAEHITNFLKENGGDIYINKPVTRPTINKGIKYLKDNGYILEEVKGSEVFKEYKGTYYKLKNKDVFNYYVLLENEFLKTLISTLSQDVIRVYLVYYSFNTKEKVGQCYLKQHEILARIGLSNSGKNYKKLRHINAVLRAMGLIEKKYKIERDVTGREISRKLITTAPYYFNTKLFREVHGGLLLDTNKKETTIEYMAI